MSEHEQQPLSSSPSVSRVEVIRSHQFLTMIIGAIVVALFLVYVALSLYSSSGTLQLDLSRPGYDSAREEVTKGSEVFQGFSEDGAINSKSLNEFDKLYKQKAAEALIDIDAFSGNALGDKALSLE